MSNRQSDAQVTTGGINPILRDEFWPIKTDCLDAPMWIPGGSTRRSDYLESFQFDECLHGLDSGRLRY